MFLGNNLAKFFSP